MSATYPLFSWGTADTVTSWNITTGAAVTSSITDPYGATAAYTVTNHVGSASLAVWKYITFTRDGYSDAGVFLKAGTAATTTVGIYDDTVGSLCFVNYAWNNGAPTGSFASGVGGVFTPISVGNGWFFCRQYTTAVIRAHATRLLIYPSSTLAASGSVSVYVKNAVLAGSPIYDAVADDQPMDASVFAKAPSGVEDSWIIGTNERLRGKLRYMPPTMTDTPSKWSAFYGYNESIGINVGFKEMLNVGRTKATIRFSQDASNISSYVDSTLFEPMTDGVSLEEDGTRTITFGIRNLTVAYENF